MNVFGVAECRYRLSAIKKYYTWIWYDADSRRHVSENSKRTVALVPIICQFACLSLTVKRPTRWF